MEERTDRATHSVHERDRAVRERDPRLGGAQHHLFTRTAVGRVGICAADVLPQRPHRRERERIGERVRAPRNIRFDRVGDRVHAGIGSKSRRHAQGELVIDQRRDREIREPDAKHLLVALFVGDDGEARRLASRPGGRRDRDDRQTRFVLDVRRLIVAHFSAMDREDGDRFGGVDRASTAEPDHAVVVSRGQKRRRRFDRRDGRVGDGLRIGARWDPRSGKQRCDALGDPVLGEERIGDDERPLEFEPGEDQRCFGNGAAADAKRAGERKERHKIPLTGANATGSARAFSS
jgi:hypothetical protein